MSRSPVLLSSFRAGAVKAPTRVRSRVREMLRVDIYEVGDDEMS